MEIEAPQTFFLMNASRLGLVLKTSSMMPVKSIFYIS